MKGGGECVVISGGEPIVTVRWRMLFGCRSGGIVVGFGKDAKMTGFTKDCLESTGDGIGGEGLFGFEIIIVGAGG